MRLRAFLPWLAGVAIMAAVGIGLYERAMAAGLRARADALARQERELSRQQGQRERLRRELLLVADAPGADEPGAVTAAVAAPTPAPTWRIGEWTAASAWHNEGRATPQATISTLLWAATGGDLAALRDMLNLDDANRAKARAWFDSLPPAGRALYATPEDLVASATLYNVPATKAQLSWLHQADGDRAVAGILLAEPESATPTPALEYQPAVGNFPPALRGRPPYRVVVLDLRRTADGWRVNVPATALDRLAKQLQKPAGG